VTTAGKANVPLAVTGRLGPPLFDRVTVPTSPLTVPPTMYVFAAQVTTTVPTGALPIVPVPPMTLQVSNSGLPGCAKTVTLNG